MSGGGGHFLNWWCLGGPDSERSFEGNESIGPQIPRTKCLQPWSSPSVQQPMNTWLKCAQSLQGMLCDRCLLPHGGAWKTLHWGRILVSETVSQSPVYGMYPVFGGQNQELAANGMRRHVGASKMFWPWILKIVSQFYTFTQKHQIVTF